MTTWMLVEDEPDLYEMVLAMYDMWGISGVSFTTGEDAVAWIEQVDKGQAEDEIPELALVDIRLPNELTGVDVAQRLRSSPTLKNMVIVLMTAYKLKPTQEAAVRAQAGANLLLYKPLPPFKKFRKILNDLLKER